MNNCDFATLSLDDKLFAALRSYRGLCMDEAINEASMQRRDWCWLDIKRNASMDRKFGRMYSPTCVPSDGSWVPEEVAA